MIQHVNTRKMLTIEHSNSLTCRHSAVWWRRGCLIFCNKCPVRQIVIGLSMAGRPRLCFTLKRYVGVGSYADINSEGLFGIRWLQFLDTRCLGRDYWMETCSVFGRYGRSCSLRSKLLSGCRGGRSEGLAVNESVDERMAYGSV